MLVQRALKHKFGGMMACPAKLRQKSDIFSINHPRSKFDANALIHTIYFWKRLFAATPPVLVNISILGKPVSPFLSSSDFCIHLLAISVSTINVCASLIVWECRLDRLVDYVSCKLCNDLEPYFHHNKIKCLSVFLIKAKV